eukprot:1887338-Amphidinium_carterae.1
MAFSSPAFLGVVFPPQVLPFDSLGKAVKPFNIPCKHFSSHQPWYHCTLQLWHVSLQHTLKPIPIEKIPKIPGGQSLNSATRSSFKSDFKAHAKGLVGQITNTT